MSLLERWTAFDEVKQIDPFSSSTKPQVVGRFPSIVVGDALVFVGIDDELAALERSSFTPVWRTFVGRLRPVGMWGTDHVCLADAENIGVLEINSRRLLWKRKTSYPRQVYRDVLLVGDEQGFSFLDPETGRVESRLPSPTPGTFNTCIVCGDIAIFQDPDDGDPLRAISIPKRRVLWERNVLRELQATHGIDYSSPLLNLTPGSQDDRFIATRGPATVALAVEDGHLLWETDVTVPYRIPIVIDGRIPVLSLERFVVIDEATGSITAEQMHENLRSMTFTKKGSAYGDTVAFVSESGHVAVIDMNDGDLLWSEQYRAKFHESAVADGRLIVGSADGSLWSFSENQ